MEILISLIILLFTSIFVFIIGRIFPRKIINENNFWFRTHKWENNGKIYEKLKIKQWKTKLPDASVIITKILPNFMPKKRIESDFRKKGKILVKETCVAEATHIAAPVIAIAISLYIKSVTFKIFTFLYTMCNIPFILIQRYNRPRLKKLYS